MRDADGNPSDELAAILAKLSEMQQQQAKLNGEMDALVQRIRDIGARPPAKGDEPPAD
jgi:hypothetical protein